MYMTAPETEHRVVVSVPLSAALTVSLAFTLIIGVYPQPFIRFAQYALLPLAAP
jgi:NADH:ubiquinone oxidoreductase subunit 2 (subunit N)